MEYDERVIINFLWNEGADASQIAARLQAQFTEHIHQLQIVEFWITEIRRDCQDLLDGIRSGKHPLDDIDCKILAILSKSPFELAHSITKRLLVAYSIVLQHFHESIRFKCCHLHWVPHLLTGTYGKMKGVCKGHVAVLICCQTGRMASSPDW